MGTSAPPERGYSDDQRVENWDSPVLYSDSNLAVGAPGIATPILDVSRYAYLAGFDSVAGGDIQAVFTWYIDAAAAVSVGGRFVRLSPSIPLAAQYRLPNLGPFLKITWQLVGGGPFHFSQIFGTNRFHPLEFIPQNPVLIDQQNVAIGASATNTLYPSDYYAGPLDIWFRVAAATLVLSLQSLTAGDVWNINSQATPATANADFIYKMTTPPGAWRLQVINTAAVATAYYLNVRPSLTGST